MHMLFDPRPATGSTSSASQSGVGHGGDEPDYTYDDMPAGQTDYRQQHFSIAHDEAQILRCPTGQSHQPRSQRDGDHRGARRLDEDKRLPCGGRLIDDPRNDHSYALYLLSSSRPT